LAAHLGAASFSRLKYRLEVRVNDRSGFTRGRLAPRRTEAAMSEFGRVDVLINNAGVAGAAPATREATERFSPIVDTNLDGSYWMAQALRSRIRVNQLPPGSSRPS
jgi:NAD(P)-dependent dehydrogenase (short-subunit alcohol dehydrogenase family)